MRIAIIISPKTNPSELLPEKSVIDVVIHFQTQNPNFVIEELRNLFNNINESDKDEYKIIRNRIVNFKGKPLFFVIVETDKGKFYDYAIINQIMKNFNKEYEFVFYEKKMNNLLHFDLENEQLGVWSYNELETIIDKPKSSDFTIINPN